MNKNGKVGFDVELDKSKKEEKEELRGVGGWLLFFIITLIFSIIILIYDIFSNLYLIFDFPLISTFFFIETAIIVLFAMSLIYLFKEDKKGVEILKWALWLPLFNVGLMFLVFFLLGISTGEETYIGIFSGLIYAIIWTSYLRKSKRVKNTYYRKTK